MIILTLIGQQAAHHLALSCPANPSLVALKIDCTGTRDRPASSIPSSEKRFPKFPSALQSLIQVFFGTAFLKPLCHLKRGTNHCYGPFPLHTKLRGVPPFPNSLAQQFLLLLWRLPFPISRPGISRRPNKSRAHLPSKKTHLKSPGPFSCPHLQGPRGGVPACKFLTNSNQPFPGLAPLAGLATQGRANPAGACAEDAAPC